VSESVRNDADRDRVIKQEYLKQFLLYDPGTGVFAWIYSLSDRVNDGDIAGCIANNGTANKNYRSIKLNNKTYLAHRLAWLYVYGKFPDNHIDHIDGNGLNNRISNLRDVTVMENHKNVRRQSNNTSGHSGVVYDKSRKKWKAEIKINNKSIYLGRFECFNDAVIERKMAECSYGFHKNHGEDRPL